MAGLAAIGGTFFLTIIGIYVYFAFALMTIAKRTNTPNEWLAWIPIANVFLITQIAKVHWATILLVLIPLANILVTIWWFWKIAEARNKPGWLGILMVVPIVNFFVIGYLAWAE